MTIPLKRALLLTLLASSGCQLFDTRPKPQIHPPGPIVGDRSVDIFVVAEDGPLEAMILIDGRIHGGPIQVNTKVTIGLLDVAQGMHTIAARVGGPVPRQSADSLLVVRPNSPRLVSALPPSGDVDPWVPLTAELAFNEAVADVTWTATSRALGPLDTAEVDAVLSADRTRLTVQLARPMVEYGSVTMRLSLFSEHQYSLPAFVEWKLPDVTVTFQSPDWYAWVHGVVQVAATPSVPLPAAELLVDGRPVASAGPSPWTFAWDSTGVPDHSLVQLSVRSPPWNLTGWRVVGVDNVPPQLRGCQVSEAAQIGAGSCVDAQFTDMVTLQVSETIAGIPAAFTQIWPMPSAYYHMARLCLLGPYPPLPADVVFTFSGTDRAGNPLPLLQSCAFTLERWWRPWGDGPASTGSGSLTARVADVSGYTESVPPYVWNRPHANLLLVGGTQADGLVRQAVGSAGGPFSLSAPLIASTPAEFVAAGDAMAWVERGDGPGLVFAASPGYPVPRRLNADATRDGRHPALVDELITAWSEETGAGGRAVRVASLSTLLGGPLGSDPAGVADFPSVGPGPSLGPSTPTNPGVAFVDTPPGAVPVVRVAGWDGQAWLPAGGPLNVDPATAAGEPLLTHDGAAPWVVFVEAGQVIARRWDRDLQSWGPPVVLNNDARRAARAPRGHGGVVAFVESGPAGDEIRVRRWSGSSWDLLPGPVNEGVPGAVTSFAVYGYQPVVVAWSDEAGLARIRFSNE